MKNAGIFLSFLFILLSISACADSNKIPFQYRLRQIYMMPVASEKTDKEIFRKASECFEIAKKDDDFASLAKKFSEEPGADQTGGDLGYIKRETVVKPFADALFSMKKGEVSTPVKTEFGYHIIKLYDIKDDTRHAAHILFSLTPDKDDSLKTKEMLTKIRDSLIAGADPDSIFLEANTDPSLKKSKGYMAWLKISDMLPEFAEAVKNLNPGEISQPFVSILGFHIVQVDSINYDSSKILE